MQKITPDNLILALDLDDPAEALSWVGRLRSRVGCFKIGLQLYSRGGADLVRRVRAEGAEVFLDLKFHDIPNTVAKAVAAAGSLDVKFLTIHSLGGRAMMEAARESCPQRTQLLAVTVLTSLDDDDLTQMGFDHTVGGEVMTLARLAKLAGLNGLVCSPLETALLRREFGGHFTLVTPGVRPEGTALDDQNRVTTPRMALENGSSHVVIGRPVMKAPSPEAVLDAILAS
jgi:orotidine-5'-phosphate decarboxylase